MIFLIGNVYVYLSFCYLRRLFSLSNAVIFPGGFLACHGSQLFPTADPCSLEKCTAASEGAAIPNADQCRIPPTESLYDELAFH